MMWTDTLPTKDPWGQVYSSGLKLGFKSSFLYFFLLNCNICNVKITQRWSLIQILVLYWLHRKAGHGPDGWMVGPEVDHNTFMVTTRNKVEQLWKLINISWKFLLTLLMAGLLSERGDGWVRSRLWGGLELATWVHHPPCGPPGPGGAHQSPQRGPGQ